MSNYDNLLNSLTMDTFEVVTKISDDMFIGEDSGFCYEKDFDGKWWVDTGDGERGPFNTLERATECMAYAYKW